MMSSGSEFEKVYSAGFNHREMTIVNAQPMAQLSRSRWLALASRTHVFWQIAFYLTPLVFLVVISFWSIRAYQLQPDFTLSSYKSLFTSSLYAHALWSSFVLASEASILATLLGLPAGNLIVHRLPSGVGKLALFVLFVPFFSNYVVRMFCWQLILADHGVMTEALGYLGFQPERIGILYTRAGVLVGLLSVLVPISTLIIQLGLRQIDPTIYKAARNLGASGWQEFWYITLPLATPALAVSALITFLFAFGDFICVSVLGGNQLYTITTAVTDRVKISDWPSAAALGVVTLLVSLAVAGVAFAFLVRLDREAVPR